MRFKVAGLLVFFPSAPLCIDPNIGNSKHSFTLAGETNVSTLLGILWIILFYFFCIRYSAAIFVVQLKMGVSDTSLQFKNTGCWVSGAKSLNGLKMAFYCFTLGH